MIAMLAFCLTLIQPPHIVECPTTKISASSQKTTIPYGNSQSLNQSATVKPFNSTEIEIIQQSVNVDNRKNIGMNGTKFEKLTAKSVVKLYNKADSRKRKIEKKSIVSDADLAEWHCPNISPSKNLEHLRSCDMPHTLRCSGDIHTLESIAEGLRSSPYTVSLLGCTLMDWIRGLVISSGEIKRVHRLAFLGMKTISKIPSKDLLGAICATPPHLEGASKIKN